ncbi:MAG: carbohydrate kinase family protein [bacterium]
MAEMLKRAVVIGGACVDLKGRPLHPLMARTSNAGLLARTTGGVALNIALNLAKLGLSPLFISMLGDDPEGRHLAETCSEAGIDTSRIVLSPRERTAIYQAVMDEEGELYVAIAAMRIFDCFTPEFLSLHESALLQASLVIADTNPPPETLHFLIEFCRKHNIALWIEPTTADKSRKIFPHLDGITYLSPNREELEILVGKKLSTIHQMVNGARELIAQGVRHVFVTLDVDGVLWVDGQGFIHTPTAQVPIADVTGAGDAFVAGSIRAILAGLPMKRAVQHGIASAVLTIQVHESVRSDLTADFVESAVKEFFPNGD